MPVEQKNIGILLFTCFLGKRGKGEERDRKRKKGRGEGKEKGEREGPGHGGHEGPHRDGNSRGCPK